MTRAPTKMIDGVTVLDNESGNKFFHKHKSPKARLSKRKNRKRTKVSRKRNRR
ncbi:hypothetical protein LCGC14_0251940 [marine sediment metagenome]|uniref:Uncharacterized protein n=1 Tax=marine sediment metagenome TaxID=412755 RepID=A0A0F9UL04_9ZZZZ